MGTLIGTVLADLAEAAAARNDVLQQIALLHRFQVEHLDGERMVVCAECGHRFPCQTLRLMGCV